MNEKAYSVVNNVKMFSWCSIPSEITDELEWMPIYNDTLFWWWADPEPEFDDEEPEELNLWLCENGAEPGERVLIEVCW